MAVIIIHHTMRSFFLLLLTFLFQINSSCQGNCDSTLFKQLIKYANQKTLSADEFYKGKTIAYNLWKNGCDDYVKTINGVNYAITGLTYEFGKICINANSSLAVKSYIDYLIQNSCSAEEQLDFSFENIFVKRPENVLQEVSKQDSVTKDKLLRRLAWGFVNNRLYGTNDPFFDNPNKAMTVYSNPPKIVLDSLNYKKIYFSLNPIIKNIYPKYKNDIDFVFTIILAMIKSNEH